MGYKCSIPSCLTINISELSKNSHIGIRVLCDYCLEDNIETEFAKSYKLVLDDINQNKKHSCKLCSNKRRVETCQEIYGVSNPRQSEEIKEKAKKTNLERHGVGNPAQNGSIKEKTKQTNLKKYGTENPAKNSFVKEKTKQTNLRKYRVEYPAQNIEVKEKAKQNNLNKYGVEYTWQRNDVKEKIKQISLEKYDTENPAQSQEIKEKTIITCLDRYGSEYAIASEIVQNKIKQTNLDKYNVEYPFQSNEIQDKVFQKFLERIIESNEIPKSKQQIYLCNLLNGNINYNFGKNFLDIAFTNEMIYIEYDGGGHDLSVKSGYISRENFEIRERNRYFYNKSNNWKLIRIISKKDLLPSDEKIIEIIDFCKDYLINQNHSWIDLDIDNSLMKCSQFTKNIDFGELRSIK